MKPLRAIGFALLTYIITLAIGIIIGLVAGFESIDMANPPMRVRVVSAAAAVIITRFMAALYFRSKKVARGALQGLYLGIYFIIVGFCLDIIARIPQYMETNTWAGLWEYYQQPIFWLTLVLIVVICIIAWQKATSRQ